MRSTSPACEARSATSRSLSGVIGSLAGICDGQRAEQFASIADRGGVGAVHRRHCIAVGRDVRQRRRVGRPGCARPELPTNAQPHPRHLRSGAFAEDLRHARHHVLGRVRATDPRGELREDLVGIRPLAIDDAVGEAPGTDADRLERDRKHDRGDHRDRGVVAPHYEAPHRDDRRVHDGDEDREYARDERLADDDVEVVQVEPEDGDPDRDREGQEAGGTDDGGQEPGSAQDEVAGDDRHEREREAERHPLDLLSLDPLRPAEPQEQRADRREEHHREQQADDGVDDHLVDEEGVLDGDVLDRPRQRRLPEDRTSLRPRRGTR